MTPRALELYADLGKRVRAIVEKKREIMKGDCRKVTVTKRELRQLAWRIPDLATFDRIVADAGASEATELLREQMRDGVRDQIRPYLRPEVKDALHKRERGPGRDGKELRIGKNGELEEVSVFVPQGAEGYVVLEEKSAAC